MNRFGRICIHENNQSNVVFGFCALQYGSQNCVMTILKTQFFRETLHQVKKNCMRGEFTVLERENMFCYGELMRTSKVVWISVSGSKVRTRNNSRRLLLIISTLIFIIKRP